MAGVSEESVGPRIRDRQLGEGSEKRKKPRPPWQEWEVSQTSLKIGVVSQHRPTARVSGSQGGGRGEGREQNERVVTNAHSDVNTSLGEKP